MRRAIVILALLAFTVAGLELGWSTAWPVIAFIVAIALAIS